MPEKLQLIKFKNPFNRYDRDISAVEYADGQTLLDIRLSQFPHDVQVVTSLNGRVINATDLKIIVPKHGDCIVFVPEIQGGGGGGGGSSKQIIGMVAMIALAIAAPYAAAALWTNPAGMGLLAGAGLFTPARSHYADNCCYHGSGRDAD